MHNAPAVNFPVGRSRFQGQCIAAFWLVGALACAYWASLLTGVGWRQSVALGVVVISGVLAGRGWWQTPSQILHWDGAAWSVEAAGTVQVRGAAHASSRINRSNQPDSVAGDSPNRLAMHLDFQRVMLLSLRAHGEPTHWLWVDKASDVTAWQALRRAVFSPIRSTTRPVALATDPTKQAADAALELAHPAKG